MNGESKRGKRERNEEQRQKGLERTDGWTTLTHTNTRTPVIKHTNNRTDVINMFPFNTAFHIGGRFKNWNFSRFVPRCDWKSGCL